MTQVWLYDKNRIFTESVLIDELGENMTTTPLLIGYIKPIFNGEEWTEGATEEEIKGWEEANKPLPQEPNEMEILQGEVADVIEYTVELDFRLASVEMFI